MIAGLLKARCIGVHDRTTIVLDLDNHGRFVPYLVIALSNLGHCFAVFRDSAQPSFAVWWRSGKGLMVLGADDDKSTGILVTDKGNRGSNAQWKRVILLDYDYYGKGFAEGAEGVLMPYYMHPTVYAQRLDEGADKVVASRKRRIRVCFAGTMPLGNAETYSKEFHFDMLNRSEVLSAVLREFSEKIEYWRDICEEEEKHVDILFSATTDTTNTLKKHGFSQRQLFHVMSDSDFFLCPPGVVMPHCHNVIEAMAHGCVPILNYGRYFSPQLEDMTNAVMFDTADELKEKVNTVLNMSQHELVALRRNVLDYYRKYLAPKSLAEKLASIEAREVRLYINNEICTVELMLDRKITWG